MHKLLIFALVLMASALVFVVNLGRFLVTPLVALEPANAVVALGGDAGSRVEMAFRLERDRFAPFVVLTGLEAPMEGYSPTTSADWRGDFLLARGVQTDTIVYLPEPFNSWTEAKALLELMIAKGWTSAIVVSDPPHMRRLSWIFGELNNACVGVKIQLAESNPTWWTADEWWSNDLSRKFVVSEVVKIIYYRWSYSAETYAREKTCEKSFRQQAD